MRNVVAPAVVIVAVGVLLGSATAVAAVRLLRSFLWGVAPTDPLTFATAILVLLAVGVLGSVIPALRVLRLDPALTLRTE
jgi:ABC-type antimicrobial peptide transport system permease subunit